MSVKFIRWLKIYFAGTTLKELINKAYDTAKSYSKYDLYIIIRLNTSNSHYLQNEYIMSSFFSKKEKIFNSNSPPAAVVNGCDENNKDKLLESYHSIKPTHSIAINAWGYMNTVSKYCEKYYENIKDNNSSSNSNNDYNDINNNIYKRALVFFPEARDNVSITICKNNNNNNNNNIKNHQNIPVNQKKNKNKISTCIIYNTTLKKFQKFYLSDIKHTIIKKKLGDQRMDFYNKQEDGDDHKNDQSFILVPKSVYETLFKCNSPLPSDVEDENENVNGEDEKDWDLLNNFCKTNPDFSSKIGHIRLKNNLDTMIEMTFPPKRIKQIKKISQEMLYCKYLTFKKNGRIFKINSLPDTILYILKNNKNWKNESQIKNEVISTLEFLNKVSLRPNYFLKNKHKNCIKATTTAKTGGSKKCQQYNMNNNNNNKKHLKASFTYEENNIKIFKIVVQLLLCTNTPLFLLNKDLIIDDHVKL